MRISKPEGPRAARVAATAVPAFVPAVSLRGLYGAVSEGGPALAVLVDRAALLANRSAAGLAQRVVGSAASAAAAAAAAFVGVAAASVRRLLCRLDLPCY